jgi:hypothetical protein
MCNVEAVELMNQMILGHRFDFHSAGTTLSIVFVVDQLPLIRGEVFLAPCSNTLFKLLLFV